MAIRAKRYFQVSFLSPLIAPLIMSPFYNSKTVWGGLFNLLFYTLVFGGIPYLLTLVALFFITRRMADREVQIVTLLTPFLFTGIMTVCYIILAGFHAEKSTKTIIPLIPIVVIVGLIVGYAYVLIVNLIYYILKSGGAIKTENPPPIEPVPYSRF
jgi:hypothetical protein